MLLRETKLLFEPIIELLRGGVAPANRRDPQRSESAARDRQIRPSPGGTICRDDSRRVTRGQLGRWRQLHAMITVMR